MFSHFVKTTKTESETLCTIFSDKIEICLYFDLYSLQNFSLWEFKSSQRPKIPQCHPSFFQEFFRNLGSKKARYFGLFWACHTFSHANMVAAAGFEPTTFGLWARRATGLLHPAITLVLLCVLFCRTRFPDWPLTKWYSIILFGRVSRDNSCYFRVYSYHNPIMKRWKTKIKYPLKCI